MAMWSFCYVSNSPFEQYHANRCRCVLRFLPESLQAKPARESSTQTCERVFNPNLRARPVVVLSANDGVVIARSKEAKKQRSKEAKKQRSKEAKSLIPMGSPLFQYTEIICKYDIAMLSSNFELYA